MEEMSVLTINHETYKRLLIEFEPHPIESERDHKQALEFCASLARKGDLITREELTLLKLLSTLVQDYERQRYQDWNSELTGRELLQALIESNDLTQSDFADIMPQSRVSDILSGRRRISKLQALALGERFHLNPAAFLRE